MKTEFADVNETRKTVRVEIPSEMVDAEIDRRRARLLAQGAHSRIPSGQSAGAGHQTALQRADPPRRRPTTSIPRAIDDALRERGVEAVDTPDVRDVDGRRRPAADLHRLVRHAAGIRSRRSTRPSRCAGRESRSTMRRSTRRCSGCAIAPARFEPVEGRGVDHGDTLTARPRAHATPDGDDRSPHDESTSSSARKANPPGFDEQLLGLEAGRAKTFSMHYPADYAIAELADTDVSYTVTVNASNAACCRSSTTSSRRISANSRRSTP